MTKYTTISMLSGNRPTTEKRLNELPSWAKKIKARRKELGVTAKQCAEAAQVPFSTWCRLEQGQYPVVVTAIRVAKFLETTVEELFGE